MRLRSYIPLLAAVTLGVACGSDETNSGGDESSDGPSDGPSDESSDGPSDGTDEQAEGPSCSFTLTGTDPGAPTDPDACSAHTKLPDCVDAEACRVVEFAPVRCTDGDACASIEREFIACVPFAVCLPHPGRLLCEVDESGSTGPAWIAFDNCEVQGFAACETAATGLVPDDLAVCGE